MPSKAEAKKEILGLVEKAKSFIPDSLLPNLEPMQGYPEVPAWHGFEHKVWKIGELIRQKMNSKPGLRSDKELQDKFIEIIKNKNAKRGRQSFIMLLACKACAPRSEALLSELNDPDVEGQVIYTWRKMQTPSHIREASPYLSSPRRWVRDEAKKYISKYTQA